MMKHTASRIRILFVSNGLGKGGKERQIHEILTHLSEHKEFECALLLRKPEINYDLSSMHGIQLYIPKKDLNARQFVQFLNSSCREFQPDIIHTWESWVTNMSHLYRLGFLKKIKVIDGSLRYARSFKKNSLHYWSARIGRMLSHRVIANSSAGLKSIDYAKPKKYHVITNAMNAKRLALAENRTLPHRPFVLSMIASFTHAKDYNTLIAAASEMMDEDYDLQCYFIGDGKWRPQMMELVPPKHQERFQFTGIVDDPERYLHASHVSVLLARKGHSEGYSNTIMESVAAGLPVICTNTGGNPEMITHLKNGFLIEHESKEQLKDAIRTLYNSPEQCREMGRQSRILAEREFPMSRLIDDLMTTYQSLLTHG